MPSQLQEHALVTLLRQYYITPSCQAARFQPNSSTRSLHTLSPIRHRHAARLGRQRRCLHSSIRPADELQSLIQTNAARASNGALQDSKSSLLFAEHPNNGEARDQEGTRIAILGGGITGLAAAHYITRELSNAKVTIYEAGNKLGGWLQSEFVDVANGKILLEKGPRTLRPNTEASLVTLDMVQNLGLKDDLLVSWKTSPAAQNRFVYYPDHLVKMPGPGQNFFDMAWTLLTEPAFKGLLRSLYEYKRPGRPRNIEDESVSSFITRRAGSPHLANNLVSAVFHGIYAGDIEKLSARSLMSKLYFLEGTAGSIGEGFFGMRSEGFDWVPTQDVELKNEILPKVQELVTSLATASVYSFKEGIGSFSDAVEKDLQANPNVQFRMNHKINSVEYDEGNGIKIKTSSNEHTSKYTNAISTISGPTLSSLTSDRLPSLSKSASVTVMVVNLYYTFPHILPEQGFGYLIPRSIPYEQNPECALGVVFDSDAIQGQDTVSGTKLTVMMGGHWWDSFSAYPDEEEGAAMARAVLKRHLKIDEEPAMVRVSLQKDCIPQYTVGHEARMKKGHEEIKEVFKGKLAVAGNSYTGVGMNDCVRAARDVVMGIKRGLEPTGLEGLVEKRWLKVRLPTREERVKALERKWKKAEDEMKGPPSS